MDERDVAILLHLLYGRKLPSRAKLAVLYLASRSPAKMHVRELATALECTASTARGTLAILEHHNIIRRHYQFGEGGRSDASILELLAEDDWSPIEAAEPPHPSRGTRWSRAIIARDGQCVECGATDSLHAHHIRKRGTHPELMYDLSNGVALCVECHEQVSGFEDAYVAKFLRIAKRGAR